MKTVMSLYILYLGKGNHFELEEKGRFNVECSGRAQFISLQALIFNNLSKGQQALAISDFKVPTAEDKVS